MKIAIIGQIDHSRVGGIETYVSMLSDFLIREGHEVTEFTTHPEWFWRSKPVVRQRTKGVEKYDISSWSLTYPITQVRQIKKIIKSNEFDLIIHNSEPTVSDWMLKQDNVIFIQHQAFKSKNKDYLKKSDRFKLLLDRIFLGLGYKGNFLSRAKNVVLFAEEESKSEAENRFYIPLPSQFNVSKIDCEKNTTLWIGRLTEEKGVLYLPNLQKQIPNLVVYGDGSEKYKKMVKDEGVQYKGLADKSNILAVYDEAKVHIVTSAMEGFAFTIVEALSRGVPVVVLNTFDAIRFFEKSSAVFPVENIDELIQKTKEINNLSSKDWEKISKNAISFAKEFLSINSFETSWRKVISKWKKD